MIGVAWEFLAFTGYAEFYRQADGIASPPRLLASAQPFSVPDEATGIYCFYFFLEIYVCGVLLRF